MKWWFTNVWKWIKGNIKLKFDINIYIFINNHWVQVTPNELKQYQKIKNSVGENLYNKVLLQKKDKKVTDIGAIEIDLNKISQKDVAKHIKEKSSTFTS